MTQIHRPGHAKNQAVHTPQHKTPRGYAPGLGGGRPGGSRSNQIRKLKAIKGRVAGTSVLPSGNSKGPRRNTQGTPVGNVGQVGNVLTKNISARTPRKLANTGSSAGPSAPGFRSFPRPKARTRSQVAG